MTVAIPPRPHVLIVEDDRTLNDQLARLLTGKGYRTCQRHCGHAGLQTALAQRFDLILLDVLLPRLDGFEVLHRLRHHCQTPVMMLTACGAEEARIRGYRRGADDYVPKPFAITELLLRIEALLRRTFDAAASGHEPDTLEAGVLRLIRRERRVEHAGQEVALTPLQFRLLWTLVRHRGEALSKPYLYQSVLEREYSRYDRSLDMHLSRVRRRLGDAGMAADRLQTVHGKGYRFA